MQEKIFHRENKIISWKNFLRKELTKKNSKRSINVKHLTRFVICITKYITIGLLEK